MSTILGAEMTVDTTMTNDICFIHRETKTTRSLYKKTSLCIINNDHKIKTNIFL